MELVARIVAACDIQNTRDICQGAAESCTPMSCLLEVGGLQFEQLL